MNLHSSCLILVACGLFVVFAADSDGDDADVDRRILESLKLAPDPDEYYQHLAAWNETDFDEWLENEVRLFAYPSELLLIVTPGTYIAIQNQDFTVDRGWIVPIIDDEDYDIDQDGRQLGKTGASSGQHTPALQAAWLTAHNKRRKAWHTRYGKSFVPVKWNEPLAQQAKSWAEHLLGSCGHGDPVHDHTSYGENLAGNYGSGSWGKLKPPDVVVTRWVDKEAAVGWHDNAHLTQALWRSTKYIGCHDAATDWSNGKGAKGVCHVQVCRYARTGNCNMGAYQKYQGQWHWLTPMLMDKSPCPPECPPGGCK